MRAINLRFIHLLIYSGERHAPPSEVGSSPGRQRAMRQGIFKGNFITAQAGGPGEEPQ